MRGWDRLVIVGATIVGLLAGGATLHARATMADVEGDVKVLKSQRVDAEKQRDEDRDRLKRIEDKVDVLLSRWR
jgi:hypothetical protein